MCTVSYLPLEQGFILTSSRDEKSFRTTLKPQAYSEQNSILVYPKDVIAGGTWIAANNKKQIACLLNGGFQNHVKQNTYSKSRGRVLLDSFNFPSHDEFISEIDLDNVEPFTLLLIDYGLNLEFNQMVWDGERKHIDKINLHLPCIWSSSTLYSDTERELRNSWFKDWLNQNREYKDSRILEFHSTNHTDIDRVNILMKRENELQTLSISQFRIIGENETFMYHDLIDKSLTSVNLSDLRCTQVLQ